MLKSLISLTLAVLLASQPSTVLSADAAHGAIFNGKDLSGWVVEGISAYKEGEAAKPKQEMIARHPCLS